MSKNFDKIEFSKYPGPVFIDTQIFIYLLDGHKKYAPIVEPFFNALSKNKIHAVTSQITYAEALVKPYEENDIELIERYQEVFTHLPNCIIAALSFSAAVRGAKIKAKYRFFLLDSFQFALAHEYACGVFLTNDKELKKYKELPVIFLDDFV